MSLAKYKIGVVIRDNETETTHHFEHASQKELTFDDLLFDDAVMNKVRCFFPSKPHTVHYGFEFLYITE